MSIDANSTGREIEQEMLRNAVHRIAQLEAEMERLQWVLAERDARGLAPVVLSLRRELDAALAEVAEYAERENELASLLDEDKWDGDAAQCAIVYDAMKFYIAESDRLAKVVAAVEAVADEDWRWRAGWLLRNQLKEILATAADAPQPTGWRHFRWHDNHPATPREGSVHETRRGTTEAGCVECGEAIGLADAPQPEES